MEKYTEEQRAILIREQGKVIAESGEVLRKASLNQLTDIVDIFGETLTPEAQVVIANNCLLRALTLINGVC
jgi:hypothetical protein